MKPLIVLTAFLAIVCQSSPAAERPNVLFLAVDDMNDWIGCLEKTPRAITPNIDKLAKSGVNFTNAHTAGVFCAPSRAAIFSGQFASTTGCYQSANYFVDHPEIESLQTSFAKAGYSTFGAGKLPSPGRRHRHTGLDSLLPAQPRSEGNGMAHEFME